MQFRFRYLGSGREEVEVASVERLRELVHSGTVGEMTLLFDALTREWAPARAHAIYRFLRDEPRARSAPPPPTPPSMTERRRPRTKGPEAPPSPEAVARPGAPEGDAGPRPAPRPETLGPSLTFSMAEPDTGRDADEAVREILKAREREGDAPVRPDAIQPWSPATAVSMVTKDAATVAAPQRSESRLVEDRRPIVFVPPPRAGWPERVHDWLHRLGTAVIDNAGPRSLPRLLVLAGLIGLLLVLVATVGRRAPASGGSAVSAAPVSPEVARLVTTLGPVQSSGFQNMVEGIDSLRRAYHIVEVPAIWLDGKYLADAPSYPDVKDFWLRYQAFLGDVRAHDTTMYRTGFVDAARLQGIEGTALTLRLSQAMRGFQQSQPQREDVYRHMEELSSAALQLHALLVDRAGDITYAPALEHGVSREPVVEAVAEDTVLHDHMWTLLDRIFASLEWIGGDHMGASRDDLADRMLKGIQATAQ